MRALGEGRAGARRVSLLHSQLIETSHVVLILTLMSDRVVHDPKGSPHMSIHLAFYEPEIPGNVGTLLRLSACWTAPLDLIGPLGFVWSDRHLKRAGLDYFDQSVVSRYDSWQAYCACVPGRKIALVPHASHVYTAFSFQKGDALVLGCESSGLPGSVLTLMDACVRIPSVGRSLNAAVAGSIAWAEALRQTNLFPAR